MGVRVSSNGDYVEFIHGKNTSWFLNWETEYLGLEKGLKYCSFIKKKLSPKSSVSAMPFMSLKSPNFVECVF
jgi:hypothetical protein